MAAQQPPQQQQVPFALAPALVNNDVINYTTPDGIKLYKNATAPLPIECDCTSERLKVFLSSLADRSSANGWDNIMDIPPVPNPNNITHNLLTEYGQVTITQCQAHAQTYVNAQNRDAQNSFNLYQCLMASLTDVARTRVMLLEDQYTVTGVRSGSCLLKIIISKSYLDSNATTSFIRKSLSSLDSREGVTECPYERYSSKS